MRRRTYSNMALPPNATIIATLYYNGSYQTWTVPTTGWYKIECWGAQGCFAGSYGGYTCGYIRLTAGVQLYIYCGNGKNNVYAATFNGGGAGFYISSFQSTHSRRVRQAINFILIFNMQRVHYRESTFFYLAIFYSINKMK